MTELLSFWTLVVLVTVTFTAAMLVDWGKL